MSKRATKPDTAKEGATAPLQFANRVGRIALCLVMVWVLLSVIQTFQEIRKPVTEETGETPHVAVDSLTNLLSGHWTFGGLPWYVATQDVWEEEVDRVLEGTPIVKENPEAELGDFVYQLLQMLDVQTEQNGRTVVYRVDDDNLRIRAYADQQSPMQIQVVRAAQRKTPDKWTFLEAVGLSTDRKESLASAPHLLPHFENHDRLAIRTDGQQLQAELIDLKEHFGVLKASWIGDGWQVSLLNQSALSPVEADTLFLCKKGPSEVIACLVGPTAEDPGMLLAVRSQ